MSKCKTIKFTLFILLLVPFTSDSREQGITKGNDLPSNAPYPQIGTKKANDKSKFSYHEAIHNWKSVNDVNDWIARHFNYDMDRAMQLANSNIKKKATIYDPTEVFNHKKGICVDLSRFAFETIQAINPTIDIKYLMIEFEPLKIGDSTFRKHWMVVYKENGRLYTMADTKRPGFISGPYNEISEFIIEYQKFRKRQIISYKLTDTYKKRLKRRLNKRKKKMM
jgi:hypothetical protein